MERTIAGRAGVGRQGGDSVRAGTGGGVPDARRAIRELRAAVYRVAGRARCATRRDWGASFARITERCVLPDWLGDVDWSFQQECYFDRGIRRATARTGDERCGSRERVGATSPQ